MDAMQVNWSPPLTRSLRGRDHCEEDDEYDVATPIVKVLVASGQHPRVLRVDPGRWVAF